MDIGADPLPSVDFDTRPSLVVGSSNITGLTEEKLHCLCIHTIVYGISILCLQETGVPKADYYSENGYRVILSGSEDVQRSWAGVGFIIAPGFAHLVAGFLQYSERLASVKINVRGGKIVIVSAYAPHNLKSHDERHNFYVDLGCLLDATSVKKGAKNCIGDFNARLGR